MKKFLFYFLLLAAPAAGQSTVALRGHIQSPKQQSLKLVLHRNMITRDATTENIALNGEVFEKEISISKPTFAFLADGKNFVQLLLEAGDDINLSYHSDSLKKTLSITGSGSEKTNFLRTITGNALNDIVKAKVTVARTQEYPFDYLFAAIDSTAASWRIQLRSLQATLSHESLALLEAEIEAVVMSSRYRSIGWIYHESATETLSTRRNKLTPGSTKKIESLLNFDDQLAFSNSYTNAVYNILFMEYDALLLSGTGGSLPEKYAYLNKWLTPGLRIPVLTLFLESDIGKPDPTGDLGKIIAETYPEESAYKTYITRYYNDKKALKKGTPAPAFTLENEKGEKVTLESFQGKVVYLDFWFAACGPCHALFKTIKPVKDHFKNNPDVVFLCISIDPKETWKSALEKYRIDGYHVFTEGKGNAHSIISDYRIYGYPTTFIIDRSGKIFNASPSVDPDELQLQLEKALK